MTNEPVIVSNALGAVISSALALAVLLGWNISAEQVAGIMLVYGNLAALVRVLYARPKVVPKANLVDGGH